MQWFNSRFHQQQPVIVVSGLPRSGTSLTMQMLQAAKIPLLVDNVRPADESNPRGYFEFEPVKQMATGSNIWVEQATGKAVKIVSPLLPYLPSSYQYHIIFMTRDIGEIVASQKLMMYPQQPADNAQSEYQQHLDKIKSWLAIQPNIKTLYTEHHQAIQNTATVARSIADFLGRDLDINAMCGVIEPNLYRNRG